MIDLDAFSHLISFSYQRDDDFDTGGAAVALFSTDHPGISLDKYLNHLKKMKAEVVKRHEALLEQGAIDDARTCLAALKYVICDVHAYHVDDVLSEVLEQADLIRVLDRGCGHSNALALLYIDIARKVDWQIEGVNFPDHFFCRLEKGGERIIFDPADGCRVLEAHDLRRIVKDALGAEAELSTEYFNGLSARDSLVSLGSKIKARYIETGEYKAALDMTERLRVLAPDEYRLLLDAGVLYGRIQRVDDAVACLEEYLDKVTDSQLRQDAEFLLYELRNS